MNKLRIAFILYMLFSSIVLFLYSKSKIKNIINNKEELNIVLTSKKSNGVIVYNYFNRSFLVKKNIKKNKFSNDKEIKKEIYFLIFDKDMPENNTFFIEDEFFLKDIKEIINKWRLNPIYLKKLFDKLIYLKKENKTDFSYLDLFNISLEILHLNNKNFIFEDLDSNNKEENILNIKKTIKIEIINASSNKELKDLIAFLRENNFDVMDLKTKTKQEDSKIISHTEDVKSAIELRNKLNLNSEINIQKEKYLIYDITLILGEDFNKKLMEGKWI